MTEQLVNFKVDIEARHGNFLPKKRENQDEYCLIDAKNDSEALITWLMEYQESGNTLQTYRKEAERFLLWLLERGQTFSDVKRQEVIEYRQFLHNPQPSERWIGPAVARKDPKWRPFTGPLSQNSINHAMTILKIFFKYLNNAGYIQANPFALSRKIRAKDTSQQHCERFLDDETWAWIVHTLDLMPRETPREEAHAERARWIFFLLYLTGARRSEVANAVMGDIQNQRGLWWWHVEGKGGVFGTIPVGEDLLQALIRYRRFLGLTDLPDPMEDFPLVGRVLEKNKDKRLTSKAIYLIVKQIFENAAKLIEQDGDLNKNHMLQKLKMATTHWLRHTSASHQLDRGVPLLVVSQNLRHKNIETTRRYLHTEDQARHEATQNFSIFPNKNG